MLASCETIAKRESKPSIVKFLHPLECIYIFYTLQSVKKKLSWGNTSLTSFSVAFALKWSSWKSSKMQVTSTNQSHQVLSILVSLSLSLSLSHTHTHTHTPSHFHVVLSWIYCVLDVISWYSCTKLCPQNTPNRK